MEQPSFVTEIACIHKTTSAILGPSGLDLSRSGRRRRKIYRSANSRRRLALIACDILLSLFLESDKKNLEYFQIHNRLYEPLLALNARLVDRQIVFLQDRFISRKLSIALIYNIILCQSSPIQHKPLLLHCSNIAAILLQCNNNGLCYMGCTRPSKHQVTVI